MGLAPADAVGPLPNLTDDQLANLDRRICDELNRRPDATKMALTWQDRAFVAAFPDDDPDNDLSFSVNDLDSEGVSFEDDEDYEHAPTDADEADDEDAPIVTADKIDADPADEIEAAPTDPDDYEANERRRLDQRYRRGPYSDRGGAPACLGRRRNSALAACQSCPMGDRCTTIMTAVGRPDRATKRRNPLLDALCERGARQAAAALARAKEREREADAARKRQTRAAARAADASSTPPAPRAPAMTNAERQRRHRERRKQDAAAVAAERDRQREKSRRQRAARQAAAPTP